MISIEGYTGRHADAWNAFVRTARNGHFLFDRRYMDYHADRFQDASLLVHSEDKLAAVLPASRSGDTCHSHQGLTFGGLVLPDEGVGAALALQMFEALASHLRGEGFKALHYKALPHIYHRRPAEEDIYALFRLGGRLARADVTTTIDLSSRGRVSQRRLRGAKKALKAGVEIAPSQDWAGFWEVLAGRLRARHGVDPVHSLAEIQLLAGRLPDNITLWTARLAGRIAAGIVLYETPVVAHAQYIAATDDGLDAGALDALFEHMIAQCAGRVRYFDFGISTEQQGRVLNEGLIAQKEGFGGSAIVHCTYVLEL